MIKRLRYQPTNGPVEVMIQAQVNHGMKPVGLWYSVGKEWEEWCEAEGFQAERLTHVYELNVDEGRILRITTQQELLDFTAKYETLDGTGWNINWQAVAEEWDGIEISPYQYGCRLDSMTRWYYGWDVASGCLWGPEALKGAKAR